MCLLCVDQAVIASGVILAACPWYKTIWTKICRICAARRSK